MMARRFTSRFSHPRQANIRDYWREAGAERCRKSTASTRAARRYKVDFTLHGRKAIPEVEFG
jgi:hypothetical protein